VNEVVPQAGLIARAEEIAAKIIANAPLAVQYTMEAVNHGMEMSLSDGLYLEAALFGICCATEDKNEGTRAFLESGRRSSAGSDFSSPRRTQRTPRTCSRQTRFAQKQTRCKGKTPVMQHKSRLWLKRAR